MKEETGITVEDICLTHFMDFTYYVEGCYVEMYVGKLNKSVEVWGEENDLYWSETDCDFFDMTKYAGEGNMGHMIELVRQYRDKVLA